MGFYTSTDVTAFLKIKTDNVYKLTREFGDEDLLSSPPYPEIKNYKLGLPNSRFGKFSIDVNEGDGFIVELNDLTIDAQQFIKNFEIAHNDFLEFLKNKNVEYSVSFGVIQSLA